MKKLRIKKFLLIFALEKNNIENGEVIFTYDVYAIYKGKLIYINMGSYRSLMDSPITNVEVEGIITLLKGDK